MEFIELGGENFGTPCVFVDSARYAGKRDWGRGGNIGTNGK